MKQTNRHTEHLIKYPLRYGIGAIISLLIIFALNFRAAPVSPTIDAWGQFGDYFGGLLNPVFGLISIVLIAGTLRSQTQSASRQAFDNHFFSLLELHSSVLTSIDRRMKSGGTKVGRDCFRLFYNKIVSISREKNVPMATAYQRFLEQDGWEIEHYFRTVYHMFKHVKDGHQGIQASPDEQKRYYDLIKSQLSRYELVLLWFNVQSINKGNWDSILNEPYAKPFEHLDRASLIENPSPDAVDELDQSK